MHEFEPFCMSQFRYTVGELKDLKKRNLWSKTTLIASSVSGAGVNSAFCKMSIFFVRSLARSVPIYRNFQSNGGKWPHLKLRKQFFYKIGNYINCLFQSLKCGHLPPFDGNFCKLAHYEPRT